MKLIGASIKRVEDRHLLTGGGRFVADLRRPGMVSAVVVRSPHAHARIARIDTRAARALPGVLDCLAFADITPRLGLIPIRMAGRPELDRYLQTPLAFETVRYVGEPVAVVVATDPYVSEDARDLIEVDYEPLPAVVDALEAMRPGSPTLYADGNLASTWIVNFGEVDTIVRAAPHVFRRTFTVGRDTALPMETRGLIAEWDAGRETMTVWGVTKVPYFNRRVLADLLGIGEDQIRFIEGDVGGGFGARGEFYPEDFLVPYLARRLGKPVRWIEDRREHLLTTNHSREQHWDLTLATDGDGRLLAIDAAFANDMGAYIRTHGTMVPSSSAAHVPGPYHVAHYRCRVSCVMTNKTPTGTMRGPGLFEVGFVRERAFDLLAAELRLEPAEIRRRNLVRREQMPYRVGAASASVPVVFDSGDFPDIFERALAHADYTGLLARCREANAAGGAIRLGVGLTCFAEPSGRGPFETARVELGLSGKVHVYTGAGSQGQGQATTLAQICADVLDVPHCDVVVHLGDTGLMPYGEGTYASRTTVMAGSAVYRAAQRVKDKILRAAAAHLEASPADLVVEAGRISVTGSPGHGCTLRDVAAVVAPPAEPIAPDLVAPLDALEYHRTSEMTFSFSVHIALVAVDAQTGMVTPLRYVLVCDVGRAINPLLVEGQLMGGVVHGLGGALLQELVYDTDGQLLTGTLMDYALPRADHVPPLDVLILEEGGVTSNPLGVKGVGETGTSGAGAALANAVAHALGPEVEITSLPVNLHRFCPLRAGVSERAASVPTPPTHC
ncbi:MAG TPA: xanthine dehydrogenase family protein molybdopterin-binding subunit [Methylomirabilota bacterium]